MPKQVSIFWFRRDLRLDDNAGLYHALKSGTPVLPIFIFDTNILDDLAEKKDKRLHFIHHYILELQAQLEKHGSTLYVHHGTPISCFKKLAEEYEITGVFTNHDYEPYATKRDNDIATFLKKKDISFKTFKDQVIFDKDEVVKADGKPYTVFTPYSRTWKAKLNVFYLKPYPTKKYFRHFQKHDPHRVPSLKSLGFEETDLKITHPKLNEQIAKHYDKTRDFPGVEGTTRLSVHLRFGTISIRQLAIECQHLNATLLNELIWREFYQMLLWHFPQVVTESFKPEYDHIKWRNNDKEFEKWCIGQTGYPIVDAGMRQLNETGFMHNRVRMITASFLTRHLLIDWRWGEAYFGKKLLDYDLAANNGGWQWAAGTGADAVPYFRIFNPELQTKRFDPDMKYIRKWVPEFESLSYPHPMVEHTAARQRSLEAYKKALQHAKH
jgi:deoxyribodipyrimidine photo-lyase